MKTEQEQIEAMYKAFCKACKDNFPNGFVCPWQSRLTRCSQCEIVCEIFYNAGYGDVSEYKAEMERLKEVIEVYKNDTERNLNRIAVENDIRRAKIDVLNELKERAVGLSAIETYHICNLIDELIKEIEK